MIKYPSKKKIFNKITGSTKNRGISLETDINNTNKYYLEINKAVIHKKPTPIKIINVDYPSRSKAIITKAAFVTPSTTDYNGIYKGRYIDFEVKETNSMTSFSLANIHNHQIEHLKSVSSHGGVSFIIIRFNKLNKVFLYSIKSFVNYIKSTNRKSIPLNEFELNGYKLKEGYIPRYDYLKIIDQLIVEEELK